jgi:Superfamily I DNA and RNA helicases
MPHEDYRKNWEEIRLKREFYNVLNNSKSIEDTFEWLSYIISSLGLMVSLEGSEIYPNEVKNLEKLLREAKLQNLKNTSIKRFANLGVPENQVTITTRHSSKGLEFEAVILLGMEEGKFPYYTHLNNPIALAEDKRLCYVCISRAKKSCILLRSEIYNILVRSTGRIWKKTFPPSQFWVSLHGMFGTKENTFTENNY